MAPIRRSLKPPSDWLPLQSAAVLPASLPSSNERVTPVFDLAEVQYEGYFRTSSTRGRR